MTREILEIRQSKPQANDDLMVAWSRSTSASSIYRYVSYRCWGASKSFELELYFQIAMALLSKGFNFKLQS